MADKVKRLAIEVARKADRVVKVMDQRIALLEWESGLLRKTLAHAADLLDRATWKPSDVKRGDVWKRKHVRNIAKHFRPRASPGTPDTEGAP